MLQLPAVLQDGGDAECLSDALGSGTSWVKMRLRFENVDQDGIAEQADAFTLRTLLGYETGTWQGLSALLEAEDVSAIGNADFNSTTNGNGTFPVVADPEGTEVNQAYLRYTGMEDTEVRAGRQRIILSNARFVGNVGWRQNEQTYDAWSVDSSALGGMDLFYAFVSNTNRIFGDLHAAGNHAMDSHLLQLEHDIDGVGHLEAFLYDLDYTDVAALSTTTIGATLSGSHELESANLLYRLTFADQTDAHDNPVNIDAGYLNLEAGIEISGVTIKVGQELLEGSGAPGDKFTTPLATLHGFNGWADKFLATPDTGLEDTYVSVGTKWHGTKLLAVMHTFKSDTGGMDYGDELDLLAVRKFDNGVTGGVKMADYSKDTFSTDTTKLWFWLAYSF